MGVGSVTSSPPSVNKAGVSSGALVNGIGPNVPSTEPLAEPSLSEERENPKGNARDRIGRLG